MADNDISHFRSLTTQFLRDHCYLDVSTLNPDDSLFESRRISSADLIDLILFMEEALDSKIDLMEISPEKLDTINMIAQFCVDKKTALDKS